jgi:hypothetical protein
VHFSSQAESLFISTALASFLFLGASAAVIFAHEGHGDEINERTMKIGKDGRVSLPNDMKLGQARIRKGRYVVAHSIEGTSHWFTFSPVPGAGKGDPVEEVKVKASKAPSRQIVRNSVYAQLYGNEYRIVKIQLAGEAVEYLF